MEIMTRFQPDGWTLRSLGQVFVERKEKGSDRDFPALSVTMNGIVPQLETAAKTDRGDDRKVVRAGDYVINSRSDRKGSSGISDLEGSVSLISIVMKPTDIEPKVAHHLLRSVAFQEEFYRFGRGIVADLWSTRYDDLKRIQVYLPPRDQQNRIASDLDRETARIDALIEKKTRFIELLKEKRQALISAAISTSLTSKSKLGRYVDILPGYAFSSAGFSQEESDIRLLRGVNVGINELRWSETVRWPANKAGALSRYQLREGDIVIGLDRPWIASGIRVASVTKADLPSLLLQRVARIRPRGSVIPGYVKLILESKEFFAYFEPELTGISVPHLSTDQVGAFPVSMPSANEQRDVCSHIELEFQRIDKLMAATDRSTNLLKERRSALITAAVTGQIDLREEE
jgi:type I restriction enzyme S subunit